MFANSIGSSTIYRWDVQTSHFIEAWTGPQAFSMYPITIPQATGNLDLIAVAHKNLTANPVVYQLVKIVNSDFAPRYVFLLISV